MLPLSFKYTIFTHIYLEKIWLFKPKYEIFDDHLRNLLGFSKIYREIFKISIPLDICLMFGMNLRPQELSKLLKMARD